MAVRITYFVHGTTIDNEQEIATGQNPGELSKLGMQQAKALKDEVADKTFDVMFCSDLKRAIVSAELGFKGVYEIIQDARLRECDYGEMNGKPGQEAFAGGKELRIDTPFPNGESYKDVEARIADFLEFLKQNYNGKHIAIMAHQAPQFALEVLLRGKSWEQVIKEDWRKTGDWKPGWEYFVEDSLGKAQI